MTAGKYTCGVCGSSLVHEHASGCQRAAELAAQMRNDPLPRDPAGMRNALVSTPTPVCLECGGVHAGLVHFKGVSLTLPPETDGVSSDSSRASALIVGICLLGAAGTAAVCAVAHYGFGWGK